jgi:hypothetical protein
MRGPHGLFKLPNSPPFAHYCLVHGTCRPHLFHTTPPSPNPNRRKPSAPFTLDAFSTPALSLPSSEIKKQQQHLLIPNKLACSCQKCLDHSVATPEHPCPTTYPTLALVSPLTSATHVDAPSSLNPGLFPEYPSMGATSFQASTPLNV